MYFIDELNGGSLYKFTSAAAKRGTVKNGKADYFAAGQTFVLRVGDGNTPNATGAYTWVPITDAERRRPARALTITDADGVTSVDARNTTDLRAVQGHRLPAPRGHADPDGAGRRVSVRDDHHHERGLPARPEANRSSPCSRTATPSTSPPGCRWAPRLASPDNLAIDHDGNIYIVEDRNGGVGRRHLVRQGPEPRRRPDRSPARASARWASNGTVGLGVHRPVLRPDRQAPRLGQHPAPRQRQRPHDRDHDRRSEELQRRAGRAAAPGRQFDMVAQLSPVNFRPRSRHREYGHQHQDEW